MAVGSNNREYQRRYSRLHYDANKAYYKARARRCSARIRAHLRETIRRMKSVPCTDCQSVYPPHVMQFDHVRGTKQFDIANVARSAVSHQVLMREIAKCEVVCANCHAERTHRRRVESPTVVDHPTPENDGSQLDIFSFRDDGDCG